MRAFALAIALSLAACSPEGGQPPAERALYAGAGRDRLCVKGMEAGFITYGEGDSNCSVRGRLEGQGDATVLVPAGDEDCRIPIRRDGEQAVLAAAAAACAYYCGPGANFAGRRFTRSADASPAVDFAGDPLC